MSSMQKMGGAAAFYLAAAYIIALVGYVAVGALDVVDPAEKVAMLVKNQTALYVLNLVAYIIWGFFQAVLALALYERLKDGSPGLMQAATAIGLIWACVITASGLVANYGMSSVVELYDKNPEQAATAWLAISSVADGLGGASGEILGGTWVLAISLVALKAESLPKLLNYFGIVLGVTAILSTIPALFLMLAIVFGLGKIAWLIWLGVILLRGKTGEAG